MTVTREQEQIIACIPDHSHLITAGIRKNVYLIKNTELENQFVVVRIVDRLLICRYYHDGDTILLEDEEHDTTPLTDDMEVVGRVVRIETLL